MQEILEHIEVSFEDLFSAISYLENHAFIDDEEYIQTNRFQIETETGFSPVLGLIQKQCNTLKIELANGAIIECADRHILFDYSSNEKFAEDFSVNDLVKINNGFSKIVNISNLGSGKVYDIEVGNDTHTYITANGVVHHNTSITAGLSFAYSQVGLKVITIVPSSDLVDQTASWYRSVGLDTGIYSGTEKNIDSLNVVATWQALQYNPELMAHFDVLIWDEAHGIKASVAQSLINEHGKHIKFRFGVTGTFPKPDAEQMALFSSIGPILKTIPAKWLIDNDYLAKIEIQPVELNETYVSENFPSYDAEKAFLIKSTDRMEMIADVIISQAAKYGNTFVLVNSIPFGKKLAALIKNSVFLYGNSEKDLRREHYDMFEEHDDLIVIASAGIASTGLSIDRIFCLIMVDGSKSFIRCVQSIGRGLRLSDDKTNLHAIDIYSKQKWAKKHAKERLKWYNEAGYPVLKKQTIKVLKIE